MPKPTARGYLHTAGKPVAATAASSAAAAAAVHRGLVDRDHRLVLLRDGEGRRQAQEAKGGRGQGGLSARSAGAGLGANEAARVLRRTSPGAGGGAGCGDTSV